MDEKVVFNPANPGDQQNQPPPGDPAAGDQPPVVPDSQTPAEAQPPADAAISPDVAADAQVAEGDTEVPVDDQAAAGTADAEPENPPPAGFLGSKLMKILIGVGVVILIIVFVIIFLPKGGAVKDVKLTWWGLWEENAPMQALISDFEKTHPHITVEYVKRTPQDYRDRLMTRLASGTGPDIFRFHNTWVPMMKDVLLPLSEDVITPAAFKEAYYPVIQHDLMVNNGIYGIPLEVDSLAMFINPQLFTAAGAQIPTTWDDFSSVVKDLTVVDANGKIQTAGAAMGAYDNIEHAPDIVSLLFAQQGIDLNNVTASRDLESGALDFYASFAMGSQKVWDGDRENSLVAFSGGKLAIYFGYSWDVFTIQNLNKNLQFKIYPVPGNQNNKSTIASYWVEGASAKSPNQKEALEFMKYLAQKDTAQKFYTETAKVRAFGEPYARKDLRESLREEPLVYPFVSQLDEAKSSYFASDTYDGDTGINSMMNAGMQTAVNSILQGAAPASAAETLNNGVKQAFQKYALPQ